jgi:hypothetical protein
VGARRRRRSAILLASATALTLTLLIAPLRRPPSSQDQVVYPGQSIGAAVQRSSPGGRVIVEPGEYREQITLREGVHLSSREPRGALVRLPATAAAESAAIVAIDLSAGSISGFRIVGDVATPLGTGLQVARAAITVVDVEVAGATGAALDLAGSGASLVGNDIHDNPGHGLMIRRGAKPRIAHSVFMRNGGPDGAAAPVVIETGAEPEFVGNMFRGIGPAAFTGLGTAAIENLIRRNWLGGPHSDVPSSPTARRGTGS